MNDFTYFTNKISGTHCYFKTFLIARSIQLENGGFSSSTECKNLLHLLDTKVCKMNLFDKIDKKNIINEIYKMKLIKCN